MCASSPLPHALPWGDYMGLQIAWTLRARTQVFRGKRLALKASEHRTQEAPTATRSSIFISDPIYRFSSTSGGPPSGPGASFPDNLLQDQEQLESDPSRRQLPNEFPSENPDVWVAVHAK